MMRIKRTIKYEGDRVRGFGKEIMSVSGCEQLQSCIQCGTCSGTCPLSIYMDFSPRQLVALVRADFKHEVLRSLTIWLCASCYACTTECPRQIPITDIMYALKQRAIKEGIYPRRFPIPVVATQFYKMVRHHGRVTELTLAMKMFLRTDWFAALKFWRLGLGVIRTGRFSLLSEHIENHAELDAMLASVDNGNGKSKEAA
jgi:heterodisulfide reductase subunit C